MEPVHVGHEDIHAAGGKHGLLHDPVARESVEGIVHGPPLDDLLARLDVGNDPKTPRPDGLCLLLPLGFSRKLDHGEPEERLVAVGQNVHVVGVEHPEVHAHRVGPGYAEEDVLAVLVHYLALVGHSHRHAHSLERQTLIEPVYIRQAGTGGQHHLSIDTAREDIQFTPEVFPIRRRKCLHDMTGFVVLSLEVGLGIIAQP